MSYSDPDPERQPLLPDANYTHDDVHDQFCQLVGVPPSDLPKPKSWRPADRSLYERAVRQRARQSCTYQMTASVANFLLLSQVVIGAAVTAMGASDASRVGITLLGAANTIIAGLVAYLKSRGQPMRARMFRDDLERVVDEIENSEIMWLGISKGVNGYDDIDTEDSVTVRSEVARLTRLYDKAVRNNTLNNPDLYGSGDAGMSAHTLRNRNLPSSTQAPVAAPPAGPASAVPAGAGTGAPVVAAPLEQEPTPLAADPDESPATAKPTAPTAVKVIVGEDADKDKKDGDEAKRGAEGADKKEDSKDGKQDDDKKGVNGESADKGKAVEQPAASGSDNATEDGNSKAEPEHEKGKAPEDHAGS